MGYSIEVLLSTIGKANLNFLCDMNLESNIVVINQNSNEMHKVIKIDTYDVFIYNDPLKGLSRSRNLALLYSSADICLICDDDVKYKKGYKNIISKAFNELPDADIIIFNTETINANQKMKPKQITKIRKAPRNKYYGSVRIAFKRNSVLNNNIWFNVNFGAGAKYSAGEESLFLKEAREKKLIIYEYPETISSVDYGGSTWFEGYNEKFFIDKGAWLSTAYPKLKHLFIFYFVITSSKLTDKSKIEIYKLIKKGFDLSKKYEERKYE